jgi:hypothetical protein
MSTFTTQVKHPLAPLVGLAALTFSALYFVSDVMELVHGEFSTSQLVLTHIAEAAIPVLVLGLYVVQRPHIGSLGLLGALGYAYAYVFFTGTVLLALVNRPANWDALVGELGPWFPSRAADGGGWIGLRHRGRQGTGAAAVDRNDASRRGDPGGIVISSAKRRPDDLRRRTRPELRRHGPLPADKTDVGPRWPAATVQGAHPEHPGCAHRQARHPQFYCREEHPCTPLSSSTSPNAMAMMLWSTT